MKTLRYPSNDPAVFMLGEILKDLGYQVNISNKFGMDTHHAVMDFQRKNNLVVDGIVGLKTWGVLLDSRKTETSHKNKFLSENDLLEFANLHQLELAAVKAVNEVESSGKGFLADGRPRILFEGHVFWKQLQNRGFDPVKFVSENTKNILYKTWTKKYYQGGAHEYGRLEKAASLSSETAMYDAAHASASYGSFQIMGFHYKDLGYESVRDFVEHMNSHEKAHLEAFGRFCNKNKLLRHLQEKNWESFAKGYNGSGYKLNKYDTKMKAAYERYSQLNAIT